MNNLQVLITIFIAVTSIAVVLQMLILFALYSSVKRTSTRVEALSNKIEAETLPTLVQTREMVTEIRPMVTSIVENLLETSSIARDEAQRLALGMDDLLDRTQMQVMRVDDLVTRTIEKLGDTTAMVQDTIANPVRKVMGVVNGAMAIFSAFSGQRSEKRHGKEVRREEMFI